MGAGLSREEAGSDTSEYGKGYALVRGTSPLPQKLAPQRFVLTEAYSKKKPSSMNWAFICQCSFNLGSVPRPILLPSIINAVRKNP